MDKMSGNRHSFNQKKRRGVSAVNTIKCDDDQKIPTSALSAVEWLLSIVHLTTSYGFPFLISKFSTITSLLVCSRSRLMNVTLPPVKSLFLISYFSIMSSIFFVDLTKET